MVQFGNEHGRYAIKGCAAFLVYGGQYNQRVKSLYHYLCTSVCQAVHGSQHHTEAVKQGHAYAEFVVLGKFHVFAGQIAIVCYVVVSQHHALRKTSSTAGVLHVHYIVAGHLCLQFIQATVVHIVT